MSEKLPLQKAREINEANCHFGAFAEIGAGQEVARLFFEAPKSKNTVAKTISAYAMGVSDAIYLKEFEGAYRIPYTSRFRLLAMLEWEHNLMIERFLQNDRNKNELMKSHKDKNGVHSFPCLFSYANTITSGEAPYDKAGRQQFQGWMGIRKQLNINPNDPESNDIGNYIDFIIHVVLLEQAKNGQFETIGKMGVNLIYASLKHLPTNEDLSKPQQAEVLRMITKSLLDGISPWKARIDVIEINKTRDGLRVNRTHLKNRNLSLIAVQERLTNDVLFSSCLSDVPGQLFSTYSPKFSSNITKQDHKLIMDNWHNSVKEDYGKWFPSFQEQFTKIPNMKSTETWEDWAFSHDDVREPFRFLARRDIYLLPGAITRNTIQAPDKPLAAYSKLDKNTHLALVVLQTSKQESLGGRKYNLDYDKAYINWSEKYPNSAVWLTRLYDYGGIVESVRKSLSDSSNLLLSFDLKGIIEFLNTEFNGIIAKLNEEMELNKNHDEERRNIERDLELTSKNIIHCLQRIAGAQCKIEIWCEESEFDKVYSKEVKNISPEATNVLKAYLSYLKCANILLFNETRSKSLSSGEEATFVE